MFWKVVGTVAAAGAAVLGFRAWKGHEASSMALSIQPGQVYAVKLRYKGAGAGGPITISMIQAYLDKTFGQSSLEVGTSVTDSTKKEITFLVMGALPANGTGAGLASVPAPWAPATLEQFELVGTAAQGITMGAPPAGSAAATAASLG